jgi:hypothetical protein
LLRRIEIGYLPASRNVSDSHRSWIASAGATVALAAILVAGLVPNSAEARSLSPISSGTTAELAPAGANAVVAAPPTPAALTALGLVPTYGYYEKLYHLPGYDPLSGYLKNMDGGDFQIPTLASSSAQPLGIYYVDNSSNLDILFLANSSVRSIAHIVPLYQLYGYNEMLDNEFFVEYGYDEALFFGTTTSTGGDYSIELVNLTSGSLLIWNTTAAVVGTNQEPLYVGNNTVIVLSSNDTIVAYNLASHESWIAGTTSYFEANNIYWIPQLQQLINVEAEGSSNDSVQQLNASYGSLGHVQFSIVTSINVDSDVRFNFVGGIGYNASLRQLAFTAGYDAGDTVYTYVLQYQPTYVLSGTLAAKYTVLPGDHPLLFNAQRYVYTSEFVLGGEVNGTQYLFDPWTGTALPTNRTFQAGVGCANACFEGLYAPSENYLLDYNASLRNESAFYNVVYAYHNASGPYPNVSQVTFRESNLPLGTSWSVWLGGGLKSSSTSTIAFAEPNGSYAYTIADVSGWHQVSLPYTGNLTVSGAPVTEPLLDFTRVTYPVVFSETGLPVTATWNVNFTLGPSGFVLPNGSASAGSPILVNLFNGTYQYIAESSDESFVTIASGSLTESAGAPPSVGVVFNFTYSVTFTETGLPSGTSWSATLGGTLVRSTTGTIEFAEPNGTHSYTIAHVSGWQQTTLPYTGTVAVSGAAVQEPTLVFTQLTYGVTFTEFGLPSGTEWWVNLTSGPTFRSMTSSLSFAEPNGSYDDTPATTDKEYASAGGSFTVNGAVVSETVTFSLVTYTVSFSESGLPSSTSWIVNIAGGPSEASTGTVIPFTEPNGTYSYTIADISGWHQSTLAYRGSFVVNGASVMEPTLDYARVTYTVEFTESGLPSGTNWSVTLIGNGPAVILATLLGSGSVSLTRWSDSATTVQFDVSNGSYFYSIYAPGHSNTTGSLAVSGPPVAPVSVSLQSSSSSGLPALDYVIIGVAAVVVAIGLVVVLLRRREKKPAGPASSPSQPATGRPPTPP